MRKLYCQVQAPSGQHFWDSSLLMWVRVSTAVVAVIFRKFYTVRRFCGNGGNMELVDEILGEFCRSRGAFKHEMISIARHFSSTSLIHRFLCYSSFPTPFSRSCLLLVKLFRLRNDYCTISLPVWINITQVSTRFFESSIKYIKYDLEPIVMSIIDNSCVHRK